MVKNGRCFLIRPENEVVFLGGETNVFTGFLKTTRVIEIRIVGTLDEGWAIKKAFKKKK